jgi:uncharacterized repeat protein (TIGR04076 family)
LPNIKITVLKRLFFEDLCSEYRCGGNEICPLFTDGQEFITKTYDPPENFCAWAWDDLYKYFAVLKQNGSFAPDMKDEDAVIACCTDGVRPVIFKLERVG